MANVPDLPFIVGEFTNHWSENKDTQEPTLNRTEFDDDEYTSCVDTDDPLLRSFSDFIHWDAFGYKQLGIAYLNEYMKILQQTNYVNQGMKTAFEQDSYQYDYDNIVFK
jgi:hypothetical protein